MTHISWRQMMRLGALLCLPLAGYTSQTGTVSQQADWAAAESGLQLSLQFPLPSVEDIDGQSIFRLEHEGLLGQAGAPDLPLVNRLVRIPDRAGANLRVLAEDWHPLDATRVRPLQERLHVEAELPLPWIEDAGIYALDGWWPQQAVSLSEPMILRDQRVVQLSVAPLRWNPTTGEL
ncbi:MAG: hypothetical protein KC518_14195, partial [Candidatus Cloacimonetes bacterium]|nr:hypothetical protein [Candidatus Cloacimonadota bacterium]